VHRDLKPDNVFLCARDDDPSFVKLVDFGISKVARARMADTLTHKGTVLGTAFYMSPEQAQSFQDIDGRTDLFSLGAILYEMLSGSPPHGGRTYEAVLIAICTHDAPDLRTRQPELPPSVAALLGKALERDRDKRFQSAEEFLGALSRVERELGFGAGPATAISSARTPRDQIPTQRFERKRYGTLVAGIVATLAGFALTAYFVAHGASQSAAKDAPSAAPPVPKSAAANPIIVSPVASESASASTAPTPATASSQVGPQKSRHPAPPKPSSHVAPGLQLSTKEP